jgi:hypothetical protein
MARDAGMAGITVAIVVAAAVTIVAIHAATAAPL